jgi:hypothetical protein
LQIFSNEIENVLIQSTCFKYIQNKNYNKKYKSLPVIVLCKFICFFKNILTHNLRGKFNNKIKFTLFGIGVLVFYLTAKGLLKLNFYHKNLQNPAENNTNSENKNC